jgi:hypothetical protein
MSSVEEAKKRVVELMTAVAKPSSTGNTTVKMISYNEHRDVVNGTVARFARRTWCDVPGYSWEVRERGAQGRRTQYTWWLDKAVHQLVEWEAGTLVARTVIGNPRGTTFSVCVESHVVIIEGLELS